MMTNYTKQTDAYLLREAKRVLSAGLELALRHHALADGIASRYLRTTHNRSPSIGIDDARQEALLGIAIAAARYHTHRNGPSFPEFAKSFAFEHLRSTCDRHLGAITHKDGPLAAQIADVLDPSSPYPLTEEVQEAIDDDLLARTDITIDAGHLACLINGKTTPLTEHPRYHNKCLADIDLADLLTTLGLNTGLLLRIAQGEHPCDIAKEEGTTPYLVNKELSTARRRLGNYLLENDPYVLDPTERRDIHSAHARRRRKAQDAARKEQQRRRRGQQ